MKKIILLISLCLTFLFFNLISVYSQEFPLSIETEQDVENIIETSAAEIGLLFVNKSLYCNIWHTECDVMGNEYWVKDDISNPKGIKSKEGHRKDHCGAIDSWYVYLDENGDPYSMLEMKAGSTNNLIPLPATFYTDNTYTELRDPATIEAGERIYWTTENKGQIWHHTGVTRLDIPIFEFVIDGTSYFLQPDETIEIEIPAGNHTIIEKYNKEYIINDVNVPFSVDKEGNTVVSVDVIEGEQVLVNFQNKPKNMPDLPPKPQPQTQQPIVIFESQTQTETQTETQSIIIEFQTQTQTQLVQTETETQTEVYIQTEPITQTPIVETELIIQTPIVETELIIQIPIVETETEPSPIINQKIIEKVTKTIETITQKIVEKQKQIQTIIKEKQSEKSIISTFETNESENNKKVSGEVKGAQRSKETEVQSEKIKNNKSKRTKEEYIIAAAGDDNFITGITAKPVKTGDETRLEFFVALFIMAEGMIIIIICIDDINKKK